MNAATVFVAAAILVLLVLAVRYLVKNGSCAACSDEKNCRGGSGSCGGCPYCGDYHSK